MKEVTLKDYPAIKSEIRQRKHNSHLTKADFQTILTAYNTDDWQPVYETRFYKEFGGEYCLLLELIG